MKIKKLSHCCLVIDIEKTRILLDPGSFSVEEHRHVKDADLILITHEHQDHFHVESLKELVKRMPEVKVITNDRVGEMLAKEGIGHNVMRHGDKIDHEGISIRAFGKDHAIMHSSIAPVSNIGFHIQGKKSETTFFFPGDAFTNPNAHVDVLALPVAGPWMKISEAIDYALALNPKMAFPVHDGVSTIKGFMHIFVEKIVAAKGIEFIKIEDGGEFEA